MSTDLKAEVRTGKSRSAIRQLRQKGRVPGSVYGKKIAGTSIAVGEKDLHAVLKENARGVIQLDIPSVGKQPVMIAELQKDKLKGGILHVDFHQISMDEPIKSLVSVELTGEAAGVKEGGILQVETYEVEVHCLPKDLPASFILDISGLHVGGNVHVSDLSVPEGVEVLTEPTDVIATVLAPQKTAETADEKAAEAAAENTAEAKEVEA